MSQEFINRRFHKPRISVRSAVGHFFWPAGIHPLHFFCVHIHHRIGSDQKGARLKTFHFQIRFHDRFSLGWNRPAASHVWRCHRKTGPYLPSPSWQLISGKCSVKKNIPGSRDFCLFVTWWRFKKHIPQVKQFLRFRGTSINYDQGQSCQFVSSSIIKYRCGPIFRSCPDRRLESKSQYSEVIQMETLVRNNRGMPKNRGPSRLMMRSTGKASNFQKKGSRPWWGQSS